MSKALFTAEAEQDLCQIVDYIAQDSVAAAPRGNARGL